MDRSTQIILTVIANHEGIGAMEFVRRVRNEGGARYDFRVSGTWRAILRAHDEGLIRRVSRSDYPKRAWEITDKGFDLLTHPDTKETA